MEIFKLTACNFILFSLLFFLTEIYEIEKKKVNIKKRKENYYVEV
jgi:hypothetical protein